MLADKLPKRPERGASRVAAKAGCVENENVWKAEDRMDEGGTLRKVLHAQLLIAIDTLLYVDWCVRFETEEGRQYKKYFYYFIAWLRIDFQIIIKQTRIWTVILPPLAVVHDDPLTQGMYTAFS